MKHCFRYQYFERHSETEISHEKILTYNDYDDESVPDFTFASSNFLHSSFNQTLLAPCGKEDAICNCQDGCFNSWCPCVNFNREYNEKYNPYIIEKGQKILNFDISEYPNRMIFECSKNCSCNRKECKNSYIKSEEAKPISNENFLICKFKKFCLDGSSLLMWGLTTIIPIPKHGYIFEYTGELINNEEGNRRGEGYDKGGTTYLFDLTPEVKFIKNGNYFDAKVANKIFLRKAVYDKTFLEKNYPLVIDSIKYGNLSRFMNHSCDPNTIAVMVFDNRDILISSIHFFSLRDIRAGEELTIDYNFYPLKNATKNKRKCACESENCRKIFI